MKDFQNDVDFLKENVRVIHNFPQEGIVTQDVMPLLQNPILYKLLVDKMSETLADVDCDFICGIESRGFMFSPAVALKLRKGFFPVQKAHRESTHVVREFYDYEYGKDTLELPEGIIKPGTKVLIMDDQVVTGGTVMAAISLIERLKGKVAGCAFILVQPQLGALARLEGYNVYSLFEKEP